MDKNTVCLGLGFLVAALTGYALSLGIDGIVYASGIAALCTIGSWVMGVDYGKKKFIQEQIIQEEDEQEGEAGEG